VAVFLSYAREDGDIAALVCQEIGELERDVVIDQEIRGGQDWWDQICDWIQETELFVVVLSEAWLLSEACQAEMSYASAMQRPFLPLAVGTVDIDSLPLELKRWQVVPYDVDSKASYKEIVRAIHGLGEPPPPPDPLPERPALPESYADPFRRALEAPSLTIEDQVSIFAVLKLHTADPRRHDEALGLIRDLRARRDLAVGVAEDIDAFLATTAVADAEAEAEGIEVDLTDLPPPPTATVQITRLKQAFVGRAIAMHLEVDGERVASVDNGETVDVTIPAGPHVLQAASWLESMGNRSDELEVILAPGAEVKLRMRFKGSLKGGIELLQVS
jgi:hypothetical protein